MDMSGVRGKKARKMQRKASTATGRTRKGRNKVPKISREDKKKGSEHRNPVMPEPGGNR
jgi:hypothetical protein